MESQQSEARESRRTTVGEREFAEQRDREQKRARLEMSRRRISRELENANSDTHRAALKNALDFLDAELKKIG